MSPAVIGYTVGVVAAVMLLSNLITAHCESDHDNYSTLFEIQLYM